MITAEMIKAKLNEKFVGKNFEIYAVDCDVHKTIREMMNEAGLNSEKFYTYRNKQTIELTYDRKRIGEVSVKKAKGSKHYSWFGDYCDWTVKDFVVELYSETLEEAIVNAIGARDKEKEALEKQLNEALELTKMLMEKTGKDVYGVAALCDFIARNKYTLSSKISE